MTLHKRSLPALLISLVAVFLCPTALAQDNRNTLPGPSQQPNISELMNSVDKNGLAQARVGVRTNSRSAREDVFPVEDAYPALSLFYSEGFKLVQGDTCIVTLRNDNTRLIYHSSLVQKPPANEHYTAELFIPLSRLSIKKGRKPYRHTSDSNKAQLLGTWRTEFKSNRSQEDVVLTLFAPGQTAKLNVWKGETLTFTFDSKETSEKFDAAFRQAIKICQPVKYVMH